ncbi:MULTISPECIES: hypothetical protein [Paracoccaceae]|uniref:hypothetical protein n=1 Tax=Paracoccaceae TaxID=31989 RepID=UPI0015749F07|nr:MULTISPECIES: hypothetical protein [Paracoccaceae]MBJ2153103.1 hypothetical protein [Paracoccus sp. IB05]NTT88198.1 hypothetical protein [Tabrizicola sp. SY72]
MPGTITIDAIFAEDRMNPPAERCLPWIESRDGITVVIEPKPHWAEDLRVFRLERREYCRYADWLVDVGRARFYGHIDTSGDDVMQNARAMIAREITEGLWDAVR